MILTKLGDRVKSEILEGVEWLGLLGRYEGRVFYVAKPLFILYIDISRVKQKVSSSVL